MNRIAIALLLTFVAAPLHAADKPYDLVIRNGRVVDGTGTPWFTGDVAIRGGSLRYVDGQAGTEQLFDELGLERAPRGGHHDRSCAASPMGLLRALQPEWSCNAEHLRGCASGVPFQKRQQKEHRCS